MNKLGRSPYITIWFYVAIGSLITWQEFYTPLTKEDYINLVTLRFFILVSAIPVAYILKKNPFSTWANSFICLNFLIYSMVGHYYRPMYYACFIQTLFAFSFLFFTTRRLYFILTSLKSLGFAAFYLGSYDFVKYQHGAETKMDFIATILVAWALSLLIHHIFTAERGLKEAANERFSMLGRHAATIIHDVKGTLSIPHLYVKEIQKSLAAKNFELATKYVGQLSESLNQSEKVIFDLNGLSRLTDRSEVSFNVNDAITGVLELLAKRIHDVELIVIGDFSLVGDKSIFSSVILNLIVNCLDNFRRSKTARPIIKIEISKTDRSIIILDNGGGFAAAALDSLKTGSIYPHELTESGLGLYLVKENLRHLEGSISFSNENNGAKIRLKFK